MHELRVFLQLRTALKGVVALAVLGGTLALAPPAGAVIPPSLEDEGAEVVADAVLPFDRTVTATPTAPGAWRGARATGHNISFDPGEPDTCGKTDTNYCDITLVNVAPGSFYDTAAGGVEFSTGGAAPGTDLDLFVYTSDAAGNVGDFVGASGGPTDLERVGVIGATGYYLVVVVYFNATNTDYAGRAEFFRRNKFPADVDNPRGLQDTLVSNPGLGYRSHSEPHLSQDPTNPNLLVGGSKMYNRDPDSLAEYEFKIGTYASFDRGRSWFDLGQLNTCPQSQAPPPSWPLSNRCYPADDPARAGTGPEDQADTPGRRLWRGVHHLGRVDGLRRRGQRLRHGARLAAVCERQRLGHEPAPLGDALGGGPPQRPHVEQPDHHRRASDRAGPVDDAR